jgi:hypothetical protein
MGKSINIFDVDDTLVVTKSKIRVFDHKTRKVIELTPQEFNTYETDPDHFLDFSDFRDAEILKAGKIIDWVFDILRRTIKRGKPVGIITARDDGSSVEEFLSHNGININPKYIFAINDPSQNFSGTTAEKKKEAFMKFIDMGFTNFQFFDDDAENIKIADSIAKEDPSIKMRTKLIKQKWIPKFDAFD